MSTTKQLSDLMISVRSKADMLPSGYTPSLTATNLFVTDPEIISMINGSWFELYDLLIEEFGDDYFVGNPFPITTDGTSQTFALPTDFYKLLGVDLQTLGASGQWITLQPFSFSERNRYSSPFSPNQYGIGNLRYRLRGNQIWLRPTPQGGQTLQLWYIPKLTPLAALTDTLDGVSGWEEYVVVDAAIKCAQKEESDVSILMAQKQALLARITEAAENRDAGSASTVSDTQRSGASGAESDPFNRFSGEY